MAERVSQYRAGPVDLDAFNDNAADRGITPQQLRRYARPDIDRDQVDPLFLSEDQDLSDDQYLSDDRDRSGDQYLSRDHDAPDPGEFIAPLQARRASISARIFVAVCAAAAVAVLFALFSSDALRDVINVKASMAGIVSLPAATAQPDPAPTAAAAGNDAIRLSAAANRTPGAPGVAMANLTPTPEELRSAYQDALQSRAPVAATVEPALAPSLALRHRLDPGEIAASLRRAEALIASGDIAAARLVLRRPAEDGDAEAAITLAGTYDPAVLEKLGVRGIVPDIAMAREWYEKAGKYGAVGATQRLERLASKPR